jgi:hypothetical protein
LSPVNRQGTSPLAESVIPQRFFLSFANIEKTQDLAANTAATATLCFSRAGNYKESGGEGGIRTHGDGLKNQ